MKEKGFTLIELLAVIVILSVITLITIPMITNVIEESKKKALVSSVEAVLDSTEYFTMSHDTGVYEFLFDKEHKGSTIKGESLDYRGTIDGEGKLYLDKEGNVSVCISNDTYYVYKNYNSGIIVGDKKAGNCIIGFDALTNKYVAMLDNGTGNVSNVYSKDEVNNLVDAKATELDNKITNNTNEITNMKSNIEELQSNLNTIPKTIDYNNLLGKIASDGNITIQYDCWLIGTVGANSSEPTYIRYGGSDGTTIYNSQYSNAVISVSLYVKANTKLYIRSGSNVSLNMFGLTS